MAILPDSYLLLVLDSCRYDTFVNARAPNLEGVGPLWRAEAPAHFTYASHQAIFTGFTPGVATERRPFINPKFAKVFKLIVGERQATSKSHIQLEGANIVDGFNRRGYVTLGTGAVSWFDTSTLAGVTLTQGFHKFYYPGNYSYAREQCAWALTQLAQHDGLVFLFMNFGETHVPYWHNGAPWDSLDNPCRPFASSNDAHKSSVRQRACLEYVDHWVGPVLRQFENIVVCADHGDAWGEDGIWEHGVQHPKVREVPLIIRLLSRGDQD